MIFYITYLDNDKQQHTIQAETANLAVLHDLISRNRLSNDGEIITRKQIKAIEQVTLNRVIADFFEDVDKYDFRDCFRDLASTMPSSQRRKLGRVSSQLDLYDYMEEAKKFINEVDEALLIKYYKKYLA